MFSLKFLNLSILTQSWSLGQFIERNIHESKQSYAGQGQPWGQFSSQGQFNLLSLNSCVQNAMQEASPGLQILIHSEYSSAK